MARPTPIIVPGGLSQKTEVGFGQVGTDLGEILGQFLAGKRRQQQEQQAQQQFTEQFGSVFQQPVPAEGPQTEAMAERGVFPTADVVPGREQGLIQTLAQTAGGRKLGQQQAAKALFPTLTKAGATPTPTDIDDFVADAVAEAKRVGQTFTPGDRNKARLQFKRAQKEEAGHVRLAKRTADISTAERLNSNAERGKQLGLIETAPSLIKAKGQITPVQKISNAKVRMESNLATLGNSFLKLDSLGAISNIEKGTFDNIIASTRSSDVGQFFGKKLATKPQSIRNKINNLKPLILQDIRQSTDMGARGLDSEKELEFYMRAATDEQADIQSNIAAIVVLDEAFGNGKIAEQLRSLTNEDLIRQFSDEGQNILQGANGEQAPDAVFTDADEARLQELERKLGGR